DLAAESTRLANSRSRLNQEIDRLVAEIESEKADSYGDAAIAEAQERTRSLSLQRDEARTKRAGLEVEAGRVAEKSAAAERDLASARRSLADIAATIRAKQM